MQTRHLFGTIATLVGGPLLIAAIIAPAAPVSHGRPALAAAGAGGAAVPTATRRAPAADVAAGTGSAAAITATLPRVAGAGLAGAAIAAGGAPPSTGYFRTIAHAGATDDAYANALPESDFALPDQGFAGGSLDGGPGAGAGFAVPAAGNNDLLLLTGFSTGGAGGSGGNPPAFGATQQAQMVSGVPDSASWISFVAGLALVGFNLRDRSRMRNVVC